MSISLLVSLLDELDGVRVVVATTFGTLDPECIRFGVGFERVVTLVTVVFVSLFFHADRDFD